MFLRGGRNRIGAAFALAALLAMVLAAPAGASGWGEERIWAGGLYQHVLAWLGLAPSPGMVLKCDDHGASIDPNGCPKASPKQGRHIGSNRAGAVPLANSKTIDAGSSIDPNGYS
jgi:hypothetical protein